MTLLLLLLLLLLAITKLGSSSVDNNGHTVRTRDNASLSQELATFHLSLKSLKLCTEAI